MEILLKGTKGLDLLEGDFVLTRKDGLLSLKIVDDVTIVYRIGNTLELLGFRDAYGNVALKGVDFGPH